MTFKRMYNYRQKESNTRPPEHFQAIFVGRRIAVSRPIFTGKSFEIFMGTQSPESAYTWRRREAVN